eukprot:TRINITY_DN5668_c0_g1_i1.p1 TRINITY_DN5668_c0_g1~~TRINITY_DN5668_c0_g1_i1.p1  ORF type:complete len:978 (-),score=212.61 TRINITY_DN5668_c0_g1_i1:257-3190(-)
MGKIVLLLLLTFSLSECRPSREERQFGWLWGNSKEKQAEQKQEPKLRPSQVLQRRTNQFVNEIQGNGLGSYQNFPPQPIINRKYPAPSISAQRGLRRPALPPPKKQQQRNEQRTVDKRKILMPVIISSYASTNIQGRGNDDQERIKEAVEKYEKLNEISDEIKSDDIKDADITEIKENYGDRVSAKVVELEINEGDNQEILILGVEEKSNDIIEEITTTELIESFTSTELSPTTTSATTTQSEIEENSSEFVTDSPFSNEIADYDEGSPYLPEIPEKLDEEIHGTPSNKAQLIIKENIPENYLAGYQQVEPLKNNQGNDRTEQQNPIIKNTERKVKITKGPQKPNIYPLGKPAPRPAFKKAQQQQLPAESQENSFFDFLPFWKSSGQAKPKRPLPPPPRRPVGPTVTKLEQEPQPDYPEGLQAPLLLKVGSPQSPNAQTNFKSRYPVQETPERPETVEEPSENARIDNTIQTELDSSPQDAFIVLPVKEPKPQRQLQKQTNKPGKIFNYPARSNARPPQRTNPAPPPVRRPPPPQRYQKRPPYNRGNNNGPLPMLSQPVIGLPQVPASRKQSPFIAKRPQLPPQLPASYPGSPKSPPKKFYPQNPQLTRNPVKTPIRPTNAPYAKKQNKKIIKKPEPFLPKPIDNRPKLPAPTKAPVAKPIDFKPNGSNKPTSDIASHLSSLLNSFFSTTASPAPAPSLPSLVEDTEFADIVNGYKSSDEQKREILNKVQTKTKPLLRNPPNPKSPVIKSEESLFDDLDSLSAPSLENKFNQKKKQGFTTKLIVTTTTQLPTTRSTTNTKLSTTSSSTSTIKPTTTQSPTRQPTTSTTLVSVQREETTLPYLSPIQELVNEYQKKGHVVPQNQYPEPVLKAIQKNFEHKKNIFEQFVSFDEGDKAFIPNKEVYGSDWSRVNPVNLSDKLLVYQTFAPTETTSATTLPPQTSTIQFAEKKSNPTFPRERNAEGGFRPMLRPLHSPLLN